MEAGHELLRRTACRERGKYDKNVNANGVRRPGTPAHGTPAQACTSSGGEGERNVREERQRQRTEEPPRRRTLDSCTSLHVERRRGREERTRRTATPEKRGAAA